MADPNLITMRSDKNSFLLFEEMDSNLLQLKELITEFNVFVDNIFQNHVADFASFAYDYEQYKTTLNNDLLRYAKKNEANTFTNSNEFTGTVVLTGETIANDLTMVSGEINNTPIGQSNPSTAHFTHLSATDSVLFNAARSLRLPIWSTATRPDAEASMIGFNTDTGEFEGHNGDEWASVGGSRIEVDSNTNANLYPIFVDSTSGTAKVVHVDDQKLKYNPQQAQLTSNWFITPTVVDSNSVIPAGFSTVTGDKELAPGVTVEIEPGAQWVIA